MTPSYGLPDPQAQQGPPDHPRFVLDEDMIRTLTPVGIRRRWRSGDVLASYGQRMDHVSVCLSGQYKVLLTGIDGQSHFMRLITAGELFGVPSALAGAPFPTDIVCEEPGQTLDIPRQVLLRMLRQEPDLALSIIKSLATRVAEMFDVMEADLLPSLRARVYKRVQRLAQFNGRPDAEGHIELPLTQQDIAQSLNASRPRVQQELKRLEREGLIRLGYRRITLLPGSSDSPVGP
jgi:CRP/FNR family cyclic AMP-dependent transcriptional regulator